MNTTVSGKELPAGASRRARQCALGDVDQRRLDEERLADARRSPSVAGETLRAHRHKQAEAYLVLDGAGIVTIDGSAHAVGPGAGVFIAGNTVHSVESTGQTELRVAYVLAADAFEDVEYVLGE